MGECGFGCSRGVDGSTGAWVEPILLVLRGAREKDVGEGSSRVGSGAYCCPLPRVASVVRASAASNVVVAVVADWAAAAGSWLSRESMVLMVVLAACAFGVCQAVREGGVMV